MSELPPAAARDTASIDSGRLHELLGRLLGDLGAAASVALVLIGDRLGLYRLLHRQGPMTAAECARASGLAERYVREWLAQQAASRYLSYDPASERFSLPPEQAMVFAIEDSPYNMLGGFEMIRPLLDSQPQVEEAFRSGRGVAWSDHAACMFCAVGRFLRPGYRSNLVSSWLPALDGAVERLQQGAAVADVGCGHGWSTILMAGAFPRSRFVGYDFHAESIAQARAHAAAHGVADRVRFEVARATDFPGRDFDLIACFDCLHDMGDPAGAARHIRSALKPSGIWMVVEPMAGDRLEDNLNPVGRLMYAGSTMVCVPSSLAQEVGTALGAQAGEAKLSALIGEAGFSRVRRAAASRFNLVLEARP